MNGKQRAFLRGIARNYSPLFQVGKTGVTPRVIEAADKALAARELIKLRALPRCPETAGEAAGKISLATGSDVIGVTGGNFVLFRQKGKDSGFDLKNLKVL